MPKPYKPNIQPHSNSTSQLTCETMAPSSTSMISTYVSISTSILLIRSMVGNFIPYAMRNYLLRKLCSLLLLRSPSTLTLIIEEYGGITQNQLYSAAETYLSSRISPDIQRLRVSKSAKEDNLNLQFDRDEKINDTFEGIELKWVFVCTQSQPRTQGDLGLQFVRPSKSVLTSLASSSLSKQECRCFELSFDRKHKERVLGSYLPYILERSKAIRDAEKVVRLHTYVNAQGSYKNIWDSVILQHPSTFETLAMDIELKKAIMDDLDRFVRRKDFYNKVGRAWKRGYLLYGPPGTGKSSLIAAMANYLRYSIYDLQLSNITRDADLRKLLLTTSNKSILVIEDIDCSVDLPDRKKRDDSQMSLSGLLNFIDGLWSCCGDERIIIFTTNHKDRIDPALLRPGRMDMHIHMSYCTTQAFKILASNYLGISGHHPLFPEIEGMLQSAEVSPAEVAEELMKSEDADVSLGEVVNLLKRKRTKAAEIKDRDEDADQLNEAKRQKVAKSGKKWEN